MEVKVTFGKIEWKGSKEEQFLKFIAKGTRPNQLFLTESIERNVSYFQDPYDWFDDILTFIYPESIFNGIEIYIDKRQDIGKVFKKILQTFDTGISSVIAKKYKLEKEIPEIPDNLIASIKKELKKKNAMIVLRSLNNKRYSIYKDKNGDFIALKMMSQHKTKGSEEEISFEINEESDGTQRIIDLLPALTDLLSNNKVFVIDELDRSLHPHLTKGIMKLFLDSNSKRLNQLIVTTHESSLLDLKLLRKDEIWFIEKNKDGESTVYSLEEFQPRYDKDIRKGYLLGRFGAIPFLKNIRDLNWSK